MGCNSDCGYIVYDGGNRVRGKCICRVCVVRSRFAGPEPAEHGQSCISEAFNENATEC